MASSRPRPQDPVNGGWSDAPLSRPHSPPPYSSPPPERADVDFALGSMDQVSMDEDSEDEVLTSEVIAAFDKLHAQLRRHRAPVVQPTVPQEPFPFMRLPLELREQVYDEYFRPEVELILLCREERLMFGRPGWRCMRLGMCWAACTTLSLPC